MLLLAGCGKGKEGAAGGKGDNILLAEKAAGELKEVSEGENVITYRAKTWLRFNPDSLVFCRFFRWMTELMFRV